MRRTQVELKSAKFPMLPDGDEVNPGLFGKRLADYLAEKLAERGLRPTTTYAEDWGWAVELENAEFPLWIGCANVDGSATEFLVFIEPSKPFVRRWFRRIETTAAVGRVAAALEAILTSDPEISDVRWVSENA